jgi:hypothetical protein
VLPIADNVTTGTQETKLYALKMLCPERVQVYCDVLHRALGRSRELRRLARIGDI